ncbi:MAG: hypothetical protein ABIH27_02380 [Candidatus Omnitrophota bacterium]
MITLEKSRTTHPDSSVADTLERDFILSFARSSCIDSAKVLACLKELPVRITKKSQKPQTLRRSRAAISSAFLFWAIATMRKANFLESIMVFYLLNQGGCMDKKFIVYPPLLN